MAERVSVPLHGLWTMVYGLLFTAGCGTAKPLMRVNIPLADLRAQPRTTAQPAAHDALQETQALYGEAVRVLKTQEGWAYVEAVEQPEFSHANRWQGYPGWLNTSTLLPLDPLLAPTIVVTEKWVSTWMDAHALHPSSWRFPLGTRLRATEMGRLYWKVELLDGNTVWMPYEHARSLRELSALPVAAKRQTVLRNAQLLLGDAYYWGGRSPRLTPTEGQVTGVDCSGLVNLAYRAAGIDLPRDAHEQFLRARPVATPEAADLVFLSERDNPQRIVHVMLYAGEGRLIEGPGTGLAIRRITVEERFGRPLHELPSGAVVDGQTVSFGTYLP